MIFPRNSIHRKLFVKSKLFSRRGLYEEIYRICDELESKLKVLNVGAGGDVEVILKNFAEDKNWSFKSLDIDPKRNPDILGSIEDIGLERGSFDMIFMVEVLEHVGDVPKALANARRMLSSRGRLFASVPFLLPIHDSPYDFYRFTEFGLKRLFSEFSHVNVASRNGYFESCAVMAMRALATHRGNHALVLIISFVCIYLIAPLARAVDKAVPLKEATTGYTIDCFQASECKSPA